MGRIKAIFRDQLQINCKLANQQQINEHSNRLAALAQQGSNSKPTKPTPKDRQQHQQQNSNNPATANHEVQQKNHIIFYSLPPERALPVLGFNP